MGISCFQDPRVPGNPQSRKGDPPRPHLPSHQKVRALFGLDCIHRGVSGVVPVGFFFCRCPRCGRQTSHQYEVPTLLSLHQSGACICFREVPFDCFGVFFRLLIRQCYGRPIAHNTVCLSLCLLCPGGWVRIVREAHNLRLGECFVSFTVRFGGGRGGGGWGTAGQVF